MGNRQSAAEVAPKRAPDLSIGSKHLLGDGVHYPGQIEVLSRKGKTLTVQVSVPARPGICPQCHHGRNLSLNITTGVVVCMTTGCGHDFGYAPLMETTVNAAVLADALAE